MSDNTEVFSGLYLPVVNKFLLVPNVSVAEIIDFQQPDNTVDSPEWCLGYIHWRGLTLPVISFEIANEEPAETINALSRLAIINTIGQHHEQLPFFALITQGIPRQIKVESRAIEEIPLENAGRAELMSVSILGDEAVIPNIDYLEELAVQIPST